MSKTKINSKEGFTLIELLIVIAIIGILAGVVLVSTSGARDKTKLSKALATMRSIESVANMCMIGGGTLVIPASGSNGGTAICNTGTETLPNITDTGFIYCGNGCGGWTSVVNSYHAISMYSDSYSGGRKIIVCGSDVDVTGWYAECSWNFTGSTGCKTCNF